MKINKTFTYKANRITINIRFAAIFDELSLVF